MDNAYVQMIVTERNRLKVSTLDLCEGICTPEHFYKVENGERELSRIMAECFLARLGVDSGNYERYVDYPEYEIWKQRMRIIEDIENDNLEEASNLLNKYAKGKNKGKLDIQFVLFMEIQIMKHKGNTGSECKYEDMQGMYEKVLKTTVPDIDNKLLRNLLLSPLEFILTLEYKKVKYRDASFAEKWYLYHELLEYIHKSHMGKISLVKVYPKTFVTMYRDLENLINSKRDTISIIIHRKLLEYCDEVLYCIRQRKYIYYLAEILEIKLELLKWLEKNDSDIYKRERNSHAKEETQRSLGMLKDLYFEYGLNCYMYDDCYLYRESGVYCINDVVKRRRIMMGLTQADLAGVDIAESTIWRIESKKQSVSHKVAKKLFERLNMYPSCINMGIVTDDKDSLDLYEELRYTINSFDNEKIRTLILKLKGVLPMHEKNKQIILAIEGWNEQLSGNMTKQQYINQLRDALKCTIGYSCIENKTEIFLTTEELTAIYLISAYYKEIGDIKSAFQAIRPLRWYCSRIEEKNILIARRGIYELLMSYIAMLYGDNGMNDRSKNISENLIRMSLKYRHSNRVHSNMYNIACNKGTISNGKTNYNVHMKPCINMSRILGDVVDERFYKDNLQSCKW